MVKAAFLGVLLMIGSSALGVAPAVAQDRTEAAPQDQPRSGAGVRSGYVTSTGATVPNPGVSQGAGTTDMDRGIQRDDNKITNSICKGC